MGANPLNLPIEELTDLWRISSHYICELYSFSIKNSTKLIFSQKAFPATFQSIRRLKRLLKSLLIPFHPIFFKVLVMGTQVISGMLYIVYL